MPLSNNFKPILVAFMNWKDEPLPGHEYDKSNEFSEQQLLQIRPFHIVNWFNTRAYGMPNPGPDDYPITIVRAL